MKKHNLRTWIIGALALQSAISFAATSSAPQKQDRPNIILILSDDIGTGDLACYGSPVADTPNLDRLKESSISFSNYHCSPMCTPTRSALLTGKDPIRTGGDFVCMGRSLPRADIPMAPQFFKDAGYRTAIIGKWHLGSNVPFRPQDRGFDEVLTFPGAHIGNAADTWENDYWSPKLLHNGEVKQYNGFCTDIWFDESMKWIESNSDQPFFLYLPLNAAHGPYWCPKDLKEKYKKKGLNDSEAQFYGLIDNIDGNMGRLRRFLKSRQLDKNTILIFSSDNGTAFGDKVFNAGMRGKKRSLYEGGHRVPLFMSAPGILSESKVISSPTQTQDLLPTLLDLTRTPSTAAFDGISFAKQIQRGSTTDFPKRKLVVQYGNDDGKGGHHKYEGTVIWDQWRLVKNSELYDLESDPGQQTNVIDQHPETARAMRQHYENWWETVPPFQYSRIHVGSAKEPIVHLSSKDWAYGYCDDPGNLRRGTHATGVWHLYAEQAGTYSVRLFRWPSESNLAITAGAPKFIGKYGEFQKGAALPVVQAKIEIAGQTQVKPIRTSDRSADFIVHLEQGETELSSWFFLENGESRCSAFYAEISRTAGRDKDAVFSHEPSDAKTVAAMSESKSGSKSDLSGLSPEQKAWELLLKKHSGNFYYTHYLAAKKAGEPSAWDYVKDVPGLPRMLIIGDSISRGYTVPVRDLLEGKVNVHRAPQNCSSVAIGVENLDLWLGDGTWDFITFNFGIHDRNTSDADYEKYLTGIVGRLKATGAKLVWVTTTPVPVGALEYVPGSVDHLNQIAASIMKEHQIQILDLHDAITPGIDQYQIHKNCHFKLEGYNFLGTRIAETVQNEL